MDLEANLNNHNMGYLHESGMEKEQKNQAGTILLKRYIIQDVIGTGGMGSVYRARDMHFPKVQKLVAIKEMISQSNDDLIQKNIVQNFEREANLLASLSHPSIPRIYDYFTQENSAYLVLEYIQGKDLEKIIQQYQNFLPVPQVIEWAIELCDVLAYLHNHRPEPIIFRDLKPSNIMINMQNHIMLIDFGIAKNFQRGEKGTMIGTEGYSPPEQYRGEASVSADIYAFGATLHHVLTRCDPRLEAPFTFYERPITSINPAVPPALENIVNRALDYKPENRYQSALEMKDALSEVYQSMKKGVPPSSTDKPAAEINGKRDSRIDWKFETQDEIRGAPCCTDEFVYFGSYDHHLYAVKAADGTLAWKYKTDGGIVTQPLVYEGVIYFGSEDHRLMALSIRSGKLLWTYETGAPIRSSPKIYEGQIFIGSDDHRLHVVNLASNRCLFKIDASGAIRSTPAFGDGLIFYGCDSGEFFAVDFHGEVRWRFMAKKAIFSTPLINQNLVCFASTDGFLYALDQKTGWENWRIRMDKGSAGSPVKAENHIIVGSGDGKIYAIDITTAKIAWTYSIGKQVSGSPVYYKNKILCGAADGGFYCLDHKDGNLIWMEKTAGAITGFPGICKGVAFIGSHDHYLYAIHVDEP